MIAVFKSRGETMTFYNILRRRGVRAVTVPTPSRRGDMCGVSVSFPDSALRLASDAVSSGGFFGFIGFIG